jgi:hypothetical protein
MRNLKRIFWITTALLGLVAVGATSARAFFNIAPSVNLTPPTPVAGSDFDITGLVIGDASLVTVTVDTGGNGNGKSKQQTVSFTPTPGLPQQPFTVKARALGVGNGKLTITAVASDLFGNVSIDKATVYVSVAPRRRR